MLGINSINDIILKQDIFKAIEKKLKDEDKLKKEKNKNGKSRNKKIKNN